MRTAVDTPAGASPELPRFRHRLGGFTVLGLFAAFVAWTLVQAALALRDAWVAPLQLSPAHEQVVQLRQRLAHEQFELARVEAEALRAADELTAIDAGLERLSALRDGTRRVLAWQAGVQTGEAKALSDASTRLVSQRKVLERAEARQRELVRRTQADLSAGLVDRTTAARESQALDGITASLLQNERELGEVRARLVQSGANARGLNDRGGDARMRHPELAAAEEREARLELELARLQAERRGLESTRRTALEGVERAQTLLAELKGRPLYRALEGTVDVAFVPYAQLAQVSPGARVIACTGGVFACRTVGRVEGLVEGEVVTQDPWGELARGRYALLSLTDETAIREKVLRIRR